MGLQFQSSGRQRSVENRAAGTLAELAADAGFPLNMQCGGQGACRGCMVKLLSGRFQIGETVVDAPAEARACKTIILSQDAEIKIPTSSLLTLGECSSADFYATRTELFQGLENVDGQLGIAVDIGTTTVAALLVELSTGRIMARESAYNRQIEMADNIASRIALCCEAENVEKLRKLLVEKTLFPMFGKLADQFFQTSEKRRGAGPACFQSLENVTRIVFSGNTVMSHLALGLSPLCIGTIPFEPITKVYSEHAALEIGLTCCPNATVASVPSISGYVGGDIVSDLYISELTNDGLELLVDIGTNGEIVLSDCGELKATATAAGPAFEGAGLLHGMRAAEGVIETIVCNADDSISYQTIGDKPAIGICGSAAVDFMATALKTGLLNQMGRFDLDRLEAANRLDRMDCHGMIVNACVIVPGQITITEFDVSQILKAKAAVYAGIRTLIERTGHQLADLDRLVLAGGFAAHLKLKNAITIGLLPELPIEKFDVVGNGSLAGAYAALGSSNVWKELQVISERPESFHLADTEEFYDRFIDALALPNLDPDEFPKTMEQL